MQDDIRKNDNEKENETPINSAAGSERTDETLENGQSGRETCEAVSAQKAGADAEKEEDSLRKETDTGAEGADAVADSEAAGVNPPEHDGTSAGEDAQAGGEPPRYSSTYAPPYYIPNFTVNDTPPEPPKAAPKEKERKRGRGWIGILIAASLILCCVAGSVGGYFAALSWKESGTASGGSDNVTILKNDGSIKVNEVITSTGYSNLTVSQVAELVADSVVEITTSQVKTGSIYGQYVTSGAGSGVIITQGGTTAYIVTNYHVVEGADKIVVRLTNGKEYTATYLDGDVQADIAMLTITVESGVELTRATLGSSASLKVGDGVVAIGNPLGQLGGTVTDGIVSALERSVSIDGNVMTLLQHNAAINPGNSGGGLFNMAGELIGIVNAKESESGIEGLGFAIPIDSVYESIILNVIENGYVSGRPSLGVEVAYGTPSRLYPDGVYVTSKPSSGNALKQYDRITAINGQTIESASDYYAAVNNLEIGKKANVTVMRITSSGKQTETKLEVSVIERSKTPIT